MPEEKILLIDGNSYLHRAFHALPRLTDANGRVVNAVYGFVKMLRKVISEQEPTHILAAFDHKEPTFRHRDFSQYKAQRPESDQDLKDQFERLFPVLDALNIKHLDYEGYEADDIIATFSRLARMSNLNAVIVTGDKDILQLVGDGVVILNGMKDIVYRKDNVKKHFGVEAGQIVDYLALVGDRSDNLPGVKGIGPVTAKKLMKEYKDIETIYENIENISGPLSDKLKKGKEEAFNTKRLAGLVENLDLPLTIDDCLWKGPDTPRLRKEFAGLNFRKLLSDWIEPEKLMGEVETSVIFSAEELENFLSSPERDLILEPVFRSGSESAAPAGLGLGFTAASTVYLPMGHGYLGAPEQPGWDTVKEIIGGCLRRGEIRISAYNFKEVYKLFKSGCGVTLEPGFDAVTADYIAGSGSGGGSLKEICARHLDWVPAEYGDSPEEKEIGSAARDVSARMAAVFYLRDILNEKLENLKLGELYRDTELPLASLLGEMELSGVGVDTEALKDTEGEFKRKLREIEKNIFEISGARFNVNSSPQLAEVLFEKIGLEPVRKTKSGYSTAEDVLLKLKDRHPLPGAVLEYRHLQKLLSTYIEPMGRLADPETGRLHTRFNIAGTATGRLSSSEPNLQNIPVRTREGRLIRSAFIPSPGYVFLSADYSQIDLRVLAHLSEDEALSESFRQGQDVHAMTAARIFDVREDKVTKDMRKKAKAVNFGIVYGISSWGLAKRSDMSESDSGEFIEKYFERYPGVKTYMETTVEEARASKHVTTLLGRRRFIPEINSRNYTRRNLSERAAINTPVQGGSADIIKAAMVKLSREYGLNSGEIRLLLQIHDELLFEVPEEKCVKYIPGFREIMESAIELSVPLVVDFRKGANLRDLRPC